jgi:hypothetical protein
MKFTFLERLRFAQSLPLPEHGNVTTLIALREIQSKFFFKPAEVKKFAIKMETKDNQVSTTWNEQGAKTVFDIKLSEFEKKTLVAHFDTLSEKDMFPTDLLDKYVEIKDSLPK